MRASKQLFVALTLGLGLALLLLLALQPAVSRARPLGAGTPVSADITSNTTWTAAGSPYTLTTDITVDAGVTLTIQPGVVVKGVDNAELRIEGHLEAMGTASQPITFTSALDSGPEQWSGIYFFGSVSNQATGNLDYVTIRYWGDSPLAGLYIWNSGGQITVNHSQIISGSKGSGNADYGLFVYESQVVVSNTTIANTGDAANDYGLYVSNNSVVTATNLTVRNNAGFGAYTTGNADFSIANSNFSDNGNYPLRTEAKNVPNVLGTGNSFSGHTPNRLLIVGGTIGDDVIFTAANGLDSYELEGDTTISSDVTLTIEPGMTVYARDQAELRIVGHLEAVGTASQPITFTSALDSGPEQWAGLYFYGALSNQATGVLDYVTVRYWGDSSHSGLYIWQSGGQVTLDHSQIISGWRDSSFTDYGLYVNDSQVVISNTTIADNGNTIGDYSLYAIGGSVVTAANLTVQNNAGAGLTARLGSLITISSSTVSNNGGLGVDADASSDIQLSTTTVSNNGGLAVRLPGRSVAQALNGGNSFTGNGTNRLLIPGGTIDEDVTWGTATGLNSYELENDTIVAISVTLTIEPGMTVYGQDNVELRIVGHLEAVGTVSQPITFTSALDSGPGQWAGLAFYGVVSNQATGALDYATIRYWGDSNAAGYTGLGVWRSGGQVTVDHSRIISGAPNFSVTDYGLYVYDSHLVISNTTIAHNGDATNDHGLQATVNSVVTATNLTVQDNAGAGLTARSSSLITVSDSTVSNNGALGVDADFTADIQLSNTAVSNNGGLAVRLPGRSVAQALNGGNSFTGNGTNRLLIPGGTIDEDVTWGTATGLDGYELENDTTVALSVTLTIEPGMTVYARDHAELRIDGHLEAVGTASQPITFTSALDSAAGQWAGVILDGTASNQGTGALDYVTIRYWGDSPTAGLYIWKSEQVTIDHSQIISGASSFNAIDYGLFIYESQVVISNTTIAHNGNAASDYGLQANLNSVVTATNLTVQNNTGTGLAARSGSLITLNNGTVSNNGGGGVDADSSSDIQLSNTTINNNGGLALRLPGRSVAQALNGGNSFTGNGTNRLLIPGGTIDEDITWGTAAGLDGYELENDTTVAISVTLTIEPGMTIFARDNTELRIQGHLEAIGTASQPITFTSALDSGPGQWSGLYFYGGASNQGTGALDYVTVRYWGDFPSAGLYIWNTGGQITLNHSRIISGVSPFATSIDYGLFILDSQVVISNTTIAGNGNTTNDYGLYATGSSSKITVSESCMINNRGTGVYLTGGASNFSMIGSHLSGNGTAALTNTHSLTVPATFTWWGQPSGPSHAGNVLGSGQAVSNFVDYSDFLDEPTCNSYLRLAKQAPDTAIAGQPITYTLTVFNRSGITATKVVITDAIPAGASVSQVLSNGNVISGEQVVKWVVDELPGQQSRSVRFIVTAQDSLLNQDYRATAGDGATARGIIPIETTVVQGGSGTFADSGQPLGSGDSQAVSLLDLDGDGDLDAVVGNGSPNEVWLNNGDGAFNQSQAPGNETSQAVALADLNGDDLPDLVTANSDSANGVWLNNGNGTFGTTSGNDAQADLTFGDSNNQAVALGDLNGDGAVDAFVANSGGNQLWLNDGNGAFAVDPGQSPGSGNSQAVALADFDGDGDLDAVVGNTAGQESRVLLNNGSGVFTNSTNLGSAGGQAVALGDVDRDGHVDILLTAGGAQPNQVWLGTGSGTFTLDSSFAVTNSQAIDLGDVDGDGDLDAVIAVGSGQPSRVWLNNGSGLFNDSGQTLGSGDSTGVGVGDLDGDGDLDSFVANAGSDAAAANRVYFNLNQQRKTVGPGASTLVDVSNGLTTTIEIPAGVLDQPTTFTFTIIAAPTPPISATLRFAQRAFILNASQNGGPVSDPFSGSVTFTVHYNPASVDEPESLGLYYRDVAADQWLDVASSCSPTSTYNTGPHFVAVAVCHLTEFSLFELVTSSDVFLPVILKNQ